jgi:protein-disulfide isomerase
MAQGGSEAMRTMRISIGSCQAPWITIFAAGFIVLGGAMSAGQESASKRTSDAVGPTAPSAERAQTERIIRDYLLEHPEVIRDALIILRNREVELQSKNRVAALRENWDVLFHDKGAATLGNANGSVQIAEFSDYNCGYCRAAHTDVAQLVAERSDIRLVVKQFPILGPDSVEAARVAIAVNRLAPEKFAEFHNRMYGLKGRATGQRAKEIAVGLGINMTSIEEVETTPDISREIGRTMELARMIGITGTPSFVMADTVLAGAVGLDRLRDVVAKLEATKATTTR